MPRAALKNLLSDIEAVEYAQHKANKTERSFRRVKEDTIRDSVVYEDRTSGERRSLPNKFIRAIGVDAAFELADPDLDVAESLELH
tara:strand:- start:12894 stop:13151 length:258 start_codon:yes stop_codon:yes gene_type:complete